MNASNEKSTTAIVFSIIALIVAIISVLLSFIPFIGVVSLILGGIAIIFSILAYFFATPHQSKSLMLAAFIVALFSMIFSYWQYQEIKNKAQETIQKITDDFDEIQQLESLDSLDSNTDEMKSRLDSI